MSERLDRTGAENISALPYRAPLPPSATPPGWRPGPPDFVGVGTFRSGTSWWHHILTSHPVVARPPGQPKEVHYFGQFGDGRRGPDAAAYHAYFPRPEGSIGGEWTPRYMFDRWTAPMLARVAPDARLLVLLRDPIDRARSGLTYVARMRAADPAAASGPLLDDTMIEREFIRSLYADQLDRLLAAFPAEQILIQQYEHCVADPAGQARAMFEFLALDPERVPVTAALRRPRNATSGAKIEVGRELDDVARAALRADLDRLAARFPEIDLDRWPSSKL